MEEQEEMARSQRRERRGGSVLDHRRERRGRRRGGALPGARTAEAGAAPRGGDGEEQHLGDGMEKAACGGRRWRRRRGRRPVGAVEVLLVGAVEVLLVGVEVPRRKDWAGAAGGSELGRWWCGGRRLGVEGGVRGCVGSERKEKGRERGEPSKMPKCWNSVAHVSTCAT